MKRLLFLSVFFFTIAFVTFQEANAITITATPESPSFGPNQWIILSLDIQGYNGGPITWIAHRPDNSTISGTINQINGAGHAVHEIVRDAYDNYFGTWSIDYMYNGVKQTISFQVNPILLTVLTDKETYYEPDTMQINLTSSYYVPIAVQAGLYHISFYDNNGSPLTNVYPIEIRALQHSIVYNFPMLYLSKYYPPGLYEFKVQYYNKVVEVPFVLGDYRKFMDISVQTDKGSYLVGEDVNFNLLFTRVKESEGILKITDPVGNTITHQFQVYSVNTNLVLKNTTNTIGTYQYETQYSGISKEGSFKVIPNLKQLPNIETEIFLDKLNYRPGEMVHVKVYSSQVTSNSITTWVVDPYGTTYQKLSFPMYTNDIILPHKVSKTDVLGQWELYVDYAGIVKSVPFYVEGSPVDYNELLNSNKFSMPTFVSTFGSSDFRNPTGITIDSNGEIYVVDSGNSKIKKFDSNGKLLLSWGSSGTGNGQFVNPDGIVVGSNYVYIADTGNARIQMFDKNGTFVYSWGEYGDSPGTFHTPTALAFDESGDLFVTDSGRDTIQIFDSHYTFTNEIKPLLTEGGNFSGINGIVFDSQNNFYSSAIDNKILKFSDSGNFINFFGSDGIEKGRFNNPTSIALDSNGGFYVADTNNHRIQKFDPDGNFILSWGTEGNAAGQFEEPVGLAIDSSDNIYVVDKGNNNIQKFALYGPVRTIAPAWVRDNTMLWSQGGLDKNEFAHAIRYLINQGAIQNLETNQTSQVKIPSWVKYDASLWTSGEIDISTFVHTLQYLISAGIVKV
jgi:sugar lactone lactonase YvrE